ncbi:hypothetical protein [Brevibacillus porteri]|uniref:hypothetical protein n=1 Tax=Brevibacillus porteri TaxID=2126350 RepID=UPI003D1A0F2B
MILKFFKWFWLIFTVLNVAVFYMGLFNWRSESIFLDCNCDLFAYNYLVIQLGCQANC